MRIHKVKSCCCGCTLETGTKIIAWLQIISGVIMTINFIVSVVVLEHVDNSHERMTKDLFASLGNIGNITYPGYPGNVGSVPNFANFGQMGNANFTSPFGNNNNGAVDTPKPNLAIFIGYIVTGIFMTVLGLILLLGAMNRRPHLLNIWIVISMIGLVLYVISVIIQIILVVLVGMYIAVVLILFTSLAGLLISYYYIMVVSSFRKEIMSGNNVV